MIRVSAAAALAALLLIGCVGEARIDTPPALAAASQRLELTGMGAGEKGSFRLGSAIGRFTRSAIRETAYDGLDIRNRGGGTFEVEGPDFASAMSARCGFNEEEYDSGLLVAPVSRFAYRCTFMSGEGGSIGTLVLHEVPRSPGKLLSGRTRAGEANIGGRLIRIRAIHDMAGGRMPTGTPLGYMFDIDGREVGAVDLNGLDKTIYAPPRGPEREAVLAASLALSILWDPME